jgi:hypothetical protein
MSVALRRHAGKILERIDDVPPAFGRCGAEPSSTTSSCEGKVIRFEYEEPFAPLLGSQRVIVDLRDVIQTLPTS